MHPQPRPPPSFISTTMEPSWGINGRGAKNKPRLILVTAFTFIACLGAFLMGFNIGYATQTLEDLNSINGSASIGVNNTAETGAFTVSHFDVALLPAPQPFSLLPTGHFPAWGPRWRPGSGMGFGHFRPQASHHGGYLATASWLGGHISSSSGPKALGLSVRHFTRPIFNRAGNGVELPLYSGECVVYIRTYHFVSMHT